MKFFKGLFFALLLNIIIIFVFVFGGVCGLCIAKSDKFAEELDKRLSSQSITTQAVNYDNNFNGSMFSLNGFFSYLTVYDYRNSNFNDFYYDNSVPVLFSFELYSNYMTLYFKDLQSGNVDIVGNVEFVLDVSTYSGVFYLSGTNYFKVFYTMNSSFDLSMLSSVGVRCIDYNNLGQYICPTFDFTDINGNRFTFVLWYSSGVATDGGIDSSNIKDYLYDSVYYYFNGSALTGNVYYQQGYTAGEVAGSSSGYDMGYAAGRRFGENVGYQNGYNAGASDANNYSFLSLIGAVVDAPMTAFTSLLNFDLLGFNMLSCITGILTIAIVIAIIRFVLGHKGG